MKTKKAKPKFDTRLIRPAGESPMTVLMRRLRLTPAERKKAYGGMNPTQFYRKLRNERSKTTF